MNLTAYNEDISFSGGDDIVFTYSANLCVDGVDTPVDISGWTVSCIAVLMQQDENGDDVLIANISITTIDNFTRKIKIPRTETLNDNRNFAAYKITVIDDDNNKRTHVQGQLKQKD